MIFIVCQGIIKTPNVGVCGVALLLVEREMVTIGLVDAVSVNAVYAGYETVATLSANLVFKCKSFVFSN